ncbi:MAG: glycosyltransferase [Planctomycetota bacterium]
MPKGITVPKSTTGTTDAPRAAETLPPLPHRPDRLAIVIPMYQEAARIAPTVADVLATLHGWSLPAQLVLVDDGSTDGTSEVARRAIHDAGPAADAADWVQTRVLPHERNRGKGAAVRTGLAAAIETGADWALMMDADNAARLREIRWLLPHARGIAPAATADFVIASRATPDADVRAVASRKLTGLAFRAALGCMGLRLARDTQCGFKLYSARAARLVLEHAQEDRYAFDIEHIALCRRAGLGVAEIGVTWRHVDGSSISPVRDGLKMLREARRIATRLRTLDVAAPDEARSELEAKPAGEPTRIGA